MMGDFSSAVWLGKLQFRGLRTADLFPDQEALKFIVTVNSDFIVTAAQNERFRRIICDNFATFDGQIVYWLARAMAVPRGMSFEKISGSTLAYDLMRYCASRGMRMFFLGGTEDVNSLAVHRAKTEFGVDVEGYSPPMFSYPPPMEWGAEVARRLESFRPHVLLVGFGSPKQELWIDDWRTQMSQWGVRVVVGCGGTLDFISGAIRRAPPFIQRIGLEGVYRLVQQPTLLRVRRLLRSCLAAPIVLSWRVRYWRKRWRV